MRETSLKKDKMASFIKGFLGSQSAENQPSGADIILKLKNRCVCYTGILFKAIGWFIHTHTYLHVYEWGG